MSAVVNRPLRIGEVAELTGTTPRTIRYYEEIGLLPGAERAQGKHRCYTEADVERVREIVRLRDLLGLSLEQLSQLLEAETARAELRREYAQAEDPATRGRILDQALRPHRHAARAGPAAPARARAARAGAGRQARARCADTGAGGAELDAWTALRDRASTAARWRRCRPATCSPTSRRARSRRCCRS